MDNMIKCITSDGAAVIIAVDSTEICAKAEQIHKTSAVVTAALGRLLTAASIMGSQIKVEAGSVTVRVKGNGPVGSITAVSDSHGNVRGYAENQIVELPLNSKGKLDVGGAVGCGTLTVIRDDGEKEPYVGSIELVSGEIAEDITAYYAISEQIPTVCSLGVLVNPDLTVNKAGGFFLQLLPGADDSTISIIEQNIKNLRSMTQMLSDGMSLIQICQAALKGFDLEIIEQRKVDYICNCSKFRVEKALVSLGKKEINDMISEGKDIEVNCHFCNKKYSFTPDQLKKLLK